MAIHPALPRFLLLYAVLYAAYGVQSPFVPPLLIEKGLHPAEVGLVLAAANATRLLVGPLAGRIADLLAAPKAMLVGFLAAAALVALGYHPAQGLPLLLAVGMLHAAVLAPIGPLSDTLALGSAEDAAHAGRPRRRFDYGWVRGAGSAAFILGATGSGQLVGQVGIGVVVWLNACLLAVATGLAAWVPQSRRVAAVPAAGPQPEHRTGPGALLRTPRFRRMLIVAALVQGSHALHDGFAMIRWRAAGMEPGTAGLLWSESVAAEVLVFLLVGRPLLARLGPGGASALTALAGLLRWGVMAGTAAVPAMALVQPLHGLTFALQHLASLRVIADIVPPHLVATALTLYATLAVGLATTLLTLASGPLYAAVGAQGFWLMALLCAAALPFTRGLGGPPGR